MLNEQEFDALMDRLFAALSERAYDEWRDVVDVGAERVTSEQWHMLIERLERGEPGAISLVHAQRARGHESREGPGGLPSARPAASAQGQLARSPNPPNS